MYLCEMCYKPFEKTVPVVRYEGNRAYLVEDENEVCPHCGGNNYTEAIRCKRCGEWKPWSQFKDFYFCHDCMDDMTGALEEIFKFSPECDEQRAREEMEVEVKTWLNNNW